MDLDKCIYVWVEFLKKYNNAVLIEKNDFAFVIFPVKSSNFMFAMNNQLSIDKYITYPRILIKDNEESSYSSCIGDMYKLESSSTWFFFKPDNEYKLKDESIRLEDGLEGNNLFEISRIYSITWLNNYNNDSKLNNKLINSDEALVRNINSGFKYFLGTVNSKPVSIILTYNFNEYIYIYSISTLPEFRNRGYMEMFIHELENMYIGKTIFLRTDSSGKAINLYKKLSYQKVGISNMFRLL